MPWIDTPLLPASMLLLGLIVAATTAGNPRRQPRRAIVCSLTALLCITFLAWRVICVATAGQGGERPTLMLVLLVVDIVAGLDFLVFLLSISRFTDRRPEAARHAAALAAQPPPQLPHVDVWIATYNEEWPILEKTIIGARHLDWPAGRLHIWVLDDGRRAWLEQRCRAHGVHYLSRPDNRHRKAGNHNHALSRTRAPYILTLDADFIPFPQAIRRLIGFFDEPGIAVVQSPQAFYNADPFRNNLLLHDSMPDDLDLFYKIMQPGRDAWGAAFYCGTSALLRRAALDAVGGFATEGDIEDQITTMKLLRAGWRTIYLGEQLSMGLAPESTAALHDQRNRWCRGSLQILFTPYSPFAPGWSLLHRLLFSQSFWVLGAVLPLYYALLPAIMWLNGPRILTNGPAEELIMMPLLLVGGIWLALLWLCERTWIPIVSPAHQLFIAIEMLPTALTSLLKPFGRSLVRIKRVTDKGSLSAGRTVDTRTLAVLVAIVTATAALVLHAALVPNPEFSGTGDMVVALGWTTLGFIMCGIAMLTCFELPYRRVDERFQLRTEATILAGSRVIEGHTETLSLGGAMIRTNAPTTLVPGDAIGLRLPATATRPPIACRLLRASPDGRHLALQFQDLDPADRQDLTHRLYLDPRVVRTTAASNQSSLIRNILSRIARLDR